MDTEVQRLNHREYEEGKMSYPGVRPVMTSSHWSGWYAARDREALVQQIERAGNKSPLVQ
jgi:hypothetical protein